MKNMINTETADMEDNGLVLGSGIHASVEVIRSQVHGKMAKILSGAGGASCQFCMLHSCRYMIPILSKDGFPINGFISEAKVLFEEVDEEEFFL